MSDFMKQTKTFMFYKFEEEYEDQKDNYNDIDEFIEGEYNTYLNDANDIFNPLNIDNPFKAYEIFNYVREKLQEYEMPDDGDYNRKANQFQYFMALDWKYERDEEEDDDDEIPYEPAQ